MLDHLLGFGHNPSTTVNLMAWKWAFEHPQLYTFIEVSQSYLIAIFSIIGYKVIGSIFRKGAR